MAGRGIRGGAAAAMAVALALVGGAAAGSAQRPPAKKFVQKRPNIVVVMTDDMRADDLEGMPITRRLIGARGLTFTNSIVTFPVCCPSRATFLTGQYSHNHGVRDNHAPNGGYGKLDHSNTLAVWLKRSGYATAHIGKYLNDYGLRNRSEIPAGWTEWHGGIDLSYLAGSINEGGKYRVLGSRPQDYVTDVYAQRALEIVKRRGKSAQPFFLWLSFYAPHAGEPNEADDPPDIPTPAVAQRHRDAYSAKPARRLPSFNAPTPVQSRKALTEAQIAQVDEAYRQRMEALLAVDEAVGKLVAGLAATGELAKTVIVFTSDNGFYLGEHRFPTGKVWFYEEGIRVPLLVRGPGIPAGATSDALVANLDLAATIAALARAKTGRAQDGASITKYFANPRLGSTRQYLIESAPKNGTPIFLGVRTQRYLYVEYPGGRQGELYDLENDPYELKSLWKDAAYADEKASLAAALARLKSCAGASCRS